MATSPKYSDPEVLAQVTDLMLRARQVAEGTISGLHRSPFHGFNVEFAEHREYTPGDDLRRLDWRVWGRTDRYYIKQYEEESNLRATLVVDSSASMRYGSGAMTKFDYGATVAAALATVLVSQQDPVGLALFDRQAHPFLPPAATQAHLVQLVGRLQDARPDRETELGPMLVQLADQIRQRGMVIIITDLFTDLSSFYDGLARLQYRGHEILILQIVDKDELELPFEDLTLFHDIEGKEEVFADPWSFRKAYQAAIETFLSEVRTACGERKIDHVLLRTDEDLGRAISSYLHARERAAHLRFCK